MAHPVRYEYGPSTNGTYRKTIRVDAGGTITNDTVTGQVLVTDARNGTTTNSFDALDRISSSATPAPAAGQSSQVTSYTYDNLGHVTAVTQPDGRVVYKRYADSGELLKTWGARTYPVEYAYDYAGRMQTMKTWQDYSHDTGAAVTTWKYNGRGFMTNKVYAGGSTGPVYRYTPGGRLYQRVWARGITTTYLTNAAGDIARITYDDGATPGVTNTFDRIGRKIQVEDGAGTHVYAYDDEGRMLVETNTSGLLAGIAFTNRFDELGLRRAVGLVNQSATLVNYQYDAASRLDTVSQAGNTAAYSYIANSPLISQIAFAQNGTNRMTTSKHYDLLNRLTNVVNTPAADSSVSFAYQNNPANQRTRVTEADGSYWVYSYDALGQVVSGKKYWSDGSVVAGQQFEYTFDDIGNRKQTKSGGDANGNNLRSAFYSANLLNQYTDRTVPGFLDVIGNATNTATVTVNATATSRKGDYYRAEVPVSNSSTSLWQSVTNTAVLAVRTNDMVTNAVGSLFVPQTPERFSYDADGNLITDGRWTNRWDAENRLVAMTSLADIPTGAKALLAFTYDHQGRRVRKTSVIANPSGGFYPSVQRRYVYDGWNCIAELDSTNGLLRSYVWGTDLRGSQQGAGGVGGLAAMTIHTGPQAGSYFYGYDGNGNVTVMVSATNGAAMAAYQYDPFGRVLKAAGPLASTNSYRFSTKVQDEETGWSYYGYRYYSPGTGRWLCRDPLHDLNVTGTGTARTMRRNGPSVDYIFPNEDTLNQIGCLGLWVWGPGLGCCRDRSNIGITGGPHVRYNNCCCTEAKIAEGLGRLSERFSLAANFLDS